MMNIGNGKSILAYHYWDLHLHGCDPYRMKASSNTRCIMYKKAQAKAYGAIELDCELADRREIARPLVMNAILRIY
jgi:hypothetical protein